MGSFALNEGPRLEGNLVHISMAPSTAGPSNSFRFQQRLSRTSTDGAEPLPRAVR